MSVLHLPTLYLNKSWLPIDSQPVWKALGTVISRRAEFLETPSYIAHDMKSWMKLPIKKGDKIIRASTCNIKVPRILLLTEYSKVPVRKVVFNRRNIWRRDHRRCQYCGEEPNMDDVTIDHIIPRCRGGITSFENCVLACTKCNLKKGKKTLAEAKMKLRRKKRLRDGSWTTIFYDKPKRPIWNPLYALKRRDFPSDWAPFLKNFDESLYWEVELED